VRKEENQTGVPEEGAHNSLLDTVNETFNSMVEDVRNMINENDERANQE
jgi:hypothetical protein